MNPFLLINGIRNNPCDMFAWTDRAERILQLEYGILSEKLEYKIGAIRPPSKMRSLSADLVKVVKRYNASGRRPNIMAHSNANVLACRAFAAEPGIKIDTLFMVMPACWSSMKDNGLNHALDRGQVKRIICFGSDNDRVVKWGGRTSFLKPLGMGYGDASYRGLTDIAQGLERQVRNIRINKWGHSDFGTEANLHRFLRDSILPMAGGGMGAPELL